ncbi:MAG: four helix bundle protein [Chitinophagales bacterium]
MEEKIQSFLDLNVWKKSHQLSLNIYKLTATFPANEQTTIVDQLKRTVTGIATYIAEGFQKRNKQEKIKLYNDAQASLNALHYLLLLSKDLHFADTTELLENTHEVQKMMSGLVRSILGVHKPNGHNKSYEPHTTSEERDLL